MPRWPGASRWPTGGVGDDPAGPTQGRAPADDPHRPSPRGRRGQRRRRTRRSPRGPRRVVGAVRRPGGCRVAARRGARAVPWRRRGGTRAAPGRGPGRLSGGHCALDAPLDVIVVRKLGVPFQPEVAMGAIGEDGTGCSTGAIVDQAGVSEAEVAEVERREQEVLGVRLRRYRRGRERVDLTGRTAIVVDDGVATGRRRGWRAGSPGCWARSRVVLAVPVGPAGTLRSCRRRTRSWPWRSPSRLRGRRFTLRRLLAHERRRGGRPARPGRPAPA